MKKLSSTNGFVIGDLAIDQITPGITSDTLHTPIAVSKSASGQLTALGQVRSAKKILASGAKELARSQTYQFAALGIKASGASVGINAETKERQAAFDALATELKDQTATNELLLNPGLGCADIDLSKLQSETFRTATQRRLSESVLLSDHLLAAGVHAAATTCIGGPASTVAFERLDAAGVSLLDVFVEANSRVVGFSDAKNSYVCTAGFDPSVLREALVSNSFAKLASLESVKVAPANRLFGTKCDVLCIGSKAGVLNHIGAGFLKTKCVASYGPIPYTTKAVVVAEENGVRVLPDFVCTAGPIFALFAVPQANAPTVLPESEPAELVEAAAQAIASLTAQALDAPELPVLAACLKAEQFMGSWLSALPFGRPFAA